MSLVRTALGILPVGRRNAKHRRSFFNALLKKLQPSNPILESIESVYDKGTIADAADQGGKASNASQLPLNVVNWKNAQARHIMDASTAIQSTLNHDMDGFKNQNMGLSLSAQLERLDELHAPSKTLQYAITLLSATKEKDFGSLIDYIPTTTLNQELMSALEKSLTLSEGSEDLEPDIASAARYLTSSCRNAKLLDSNDQEMLKKYQSAVDQIARELLSSSSLASKTAIQNMYQYLGLKTEIAKLYGHSTVVDQIMADRAASLDQLHHLHESVRDRVLPHLHLPSETTDAELTSLLGMSAPPMGAASGAHFDDPKRQDEKEMIRLEHHVTLDGVLAFCLHLCRDMFGVDLVEQVGRSSNPFHWENSVRLYHVYDSRNDNHIGSFYIDPFERPGKLRRPVTIPVLPRSPTVAPIVCMSLSIQTPTWDTDPAALTWDDTECFLHELGHVMDFLLSSNRLGSIAGPVETLPFDRSELLPKFMELWLLEKSTIYALMDASRSRVGFSDESIDAAFRVRTYRKHLELAQLAFYGSLELYIFSNFDIRGEETLLSLQSRWAKEYSPHDLPPDKTIGPLMNIFKENAAGRSVAYYRYLWCEAQGAALFERMKESHGQLSALEMQRQVRNQLLTQGESEWPGADSLLLRYSI